MFRAFVCISKYLFQQEQPLVAVISQANIVSVRASSWTGVMYETITSSAAFVAIGPVWASINTRRNTYIICRCEGGSVGTVILEGGSLGTVILEGGSLGTGKRTARPGVGVLKLLG